MGRAAVLVRWAVVSGLHSRLGHWGHHCRLHTPWLSPVSLNTKCIAAILLLVSFAIHGHLLSLDELFWEGGSLSLCVSPLSVHYPPTRPMERDLWYLSTQLYIWGLVSHVDSLSPIQFQFDTESMSSCFSVSCDFMFFDFMVCVRACVCVCVYASFA